MYKVNHIKLIDYSITKHEEMHSNQSHYKALIHLLEIRRRIVGRTLV